MDLFKLSTSNSRLKILNLFLTDPNRAYYLHEIAKLTSISAGNIRRELKIMVKSGLFQSYRQGRLVYFIINQDTVLFEAVKTLMKNASVSANEDIYGQALSWVSKPTASSLPKEIYCQTRDIFLARLQSFAERLEIKIGTDAYLVAAVAGEIGNNSFDHNLGNWPDLPGICFASSPNRVVLADRGQGILKTIRNVRPQVKNDARALKVAFTEVVSGRYGEKRGNGLKFVSSVVSDKNWSLRFQSGRALLELSKEKKLKITEMPGIIRGCLAMLKY
ncbi:MAG: hypothetical protein UV73_C0008G0010 [Candidatus Gottesmanbacteria bacterium GW2011_GWA2_43_14]|uniref:HTH arsR-type domain-containing protein n=1 Tax=Candidatus Gottesmanbacteria bacterium GW2011_GWA2_43_14 TaxID=1618443 RepID=A0A0G1DI02_9BACT|nr:MAG: hypothetical protein UV73_C0008G0010 [Candidatus Gottesmanbacteria bacterium GW2011_GWA2_43_14]